MKKGFTLIELMIVISVIGILSGVLLSVINVNRIRARAQDAVRRQDISTIAGALGRYYADYNKYPNTVSYINNSVLANSLVPGYLKIFPSDPVPSYSYWYLSDGQNYCLCFTSDVETADVLPTGCPPNPISANVDICITNTF